MCSGKFLVPGRYAFLSPAAYGKNSFTFPKIPFSRVKKLLGDLDTNTCPWPSGQSPSSGSNRQTQPMAIGLPKNNE